MTDKAEEQQSRRDLGSASTSIFGGLGIGLMVGALLGFAGDSPEGTTVGVFIGAVGTALAALLGLNDSHFSKTKGLRIGSFGLAVVIAAPVAIYVRDHGLLTPQPASPPSFAQRIGELTEAGFKKQEALDILRESLTVSSTPNMLAANVPDRKTSFLHSSNAEFELCTDLAGLSPDPATEMADSFGVYAENYKLGKKKWLPLIDYTFNDGSAAESLSSSDRQVLLFIARDTDCVSVDFPDRLKVANEVCEDLKVPRGTTREKALWLVPDHHDVLAARLDKLSDEGAEPGFRLLAEFLCR